MTLIIDATIVRTRITGLERYTMEVSKALALHASHAGHAVVILIAFDTRAFDGEEYRSPLIELKRSPWKRQLFTEQIWIPRIVSGLKNAVCFFPAFPPGLMLRLSRRPGKIFRTVHDAVMWRFPEYLSWKNKVYMRPIERCWMNRYDGIITVSEFSENEIVDCFPSLYGKVTNAGEGVDYKKYSTAHSPSVKASVGERYQLPAKFILFVGTHDPRKNLSLLIEAISVLKRRIPDIRLVIVGREGWGTKALLHDITRLKVDDSVQILGAVDDADLPVIYSLASVLALPSRYEGFGLPILEAMASGIPVVTSNCASMPEICGDAAFLLQPNDLTAWTEILSSILHETVDIASRIEEGHLQAQRYSWETTAQKILRSLA